MVRYFLTIGACVVWLFSCVQVLQAQAIPPRHTLPDSAMEPGMIQVRLSVAALQRMPGGMLPLHEPVGKYLPELDSVCQRLGVVHFQPLITVLRQASKNIYFPSENPVLRWGVLTLPATSKWTMAIDMLAACKPWVEIAEPVYKKVLHQDELPFFETTWFPDDSLFARQWHYHNTGQTGGTPDADIDLPEAWTIERGHPDVLVAVMDNGVDTTHADLRPNLSEQRGYNFYDRIPALIPGNHGNHTAGTIAAVNNNLAWVSGIAGGDGTAGSGIRLLSCQVFGVPAGSGGIENAFVWSAQQGAAISSNSWGFLFADSYNQSVLDAIDFFIKNGGGGVLKQGLVIFSAGNSSDYARRWPGTYHKVLGVAATNHADRKTWYATYHENVDISAPGGELNIVAGGQLVDGGRRGVLSTVIQREGAAAYFQGSSMAAPHVSGVAALIASHGRGRLSADDVKSILLTSTDTIDALQEPVFRQRMGTGRLNAHKALVQTKALMAQPVVAAPSAITAGFFCGLARISWIAPPGQTVLIAMSTQYNRGGLFGLPSGSYQAGDTIAGGGRVVYIGKGNTFDYGPLEPGITYFFKIWAIGAGGTFSMGMVPENGISGQPPVDEFTLTADCYQSTLLTWQGIAACPVPQVLIAWNDINDFGIPAGNYAPGDAVGNARVIYTGNAGNFRHNEPWMQDSAARWYALWPILPQGGYGAPIIRQIFSPPAIDDFGLQAVTSGSITTAWQRNACYTGEVLLAVSPTGNFTPPAGALAAGDSFGADAMVLYKGNALNFSHTGLSSNTVYHYALWPVLPNQAYGHARLLAGRTLCDNNALHLPYTDTIGPASLHACALDTIGFRNFTAGPWPTLQVAGSGTFPTVSPFQGNFMLRFNSFDTRETNEVWMTTPPLRTIGIPSVDVAWMWYEDGSDYNSNFFRSEGVTLQWSTDNINWQTVVRNPRIPEFGGNRWKHKQVTLPAGAGNRATLFIRWQFRSAWGYNCYLDDIRIFATRPAAGSNGFDTAVAQFTAPDGWTHYYEKGGQVLLSAGQGAAAVGHVDEQLVLGAGGLPAVVPVPQQNNYVQNPGGWAAWGRYWQIRQWQKPTASIPVRFYMAQPEWQALRGFAQSGFNPPAATSDTLALVAYHLRGATGHAANPAGGHPGFAVATDFLASGFWQFDSSLAVADSLHYTSGDFVPGWYWVEVPVAEAGSGGMGIGHPRGNGALAPYWLQVNAERITKATRLQWRTGYERNWLQMDVQRAAEGGSFQSIAMLFPIGASQAGSSYSFTDAGLMPNGPLSYRVVATNTRGQKFVSPVAQVMVNDTRGLLVFPNPPAGGQVTVFAETSMEWLRLMDITGRVIYTARPASTQWLLPVYSLPAGVYLLQVSLQDGQTRTTKIFTNR